MFNIRVFIFHFYFIWHDLCARMPTTTTFRLHSNICHVILCSGRLLAWSFFFVVFFSFISVSSVFLSLFGYCHHFFVRILFVIFFFFFTSFSVVVALVAIYSIYLHCAVFACTQTETVFSWFVSWFVSHLLLSDGFCLFVHFFLSILVFTPNRTSSQTQTLAHKRVNIPFVSFW